MGELLIFAFAAWISYSAIAALIKSLTQSRSRRVQSNDQPKQLTYNLLADPASRLLLGLAGNTEAKPLLERIQMDPAFAAEVASRRREIIRAFASGQLPDDLRDRFRAHLLQSPGAAVELEVERVLNAVTAADYDRLRVQISYRIGRIEALWRRLTLPRLPQTVQSVDGPCLMLKPAASEMDSPPELEGHVAAIDGERAVLDIGLHHGLGPGDLVQFRSETSGEWIGVGVIESAGEASSTSLWMGEQAPQTGDRAIAEFASDPI